MRPSPASLAATIGEALSLAGKVLRGELELIKAEMAEKFQQAQRGLLMIAIAALLGLATLMLLAATLVLTLIAAGLHPALAALGVTTVFFVATMLLLNSGLRALKPENLVPRKTLGQLQFSAAPEKED